MKVLITGGSGYVGTTLIEELNALDNVENIFVYDNLSSSSIGFFLGKTKLNKVKFIKGDILDTYALEQIITEVDVIYHLAAYVSFPYNHQQNMQYDQINKWGTLNLVRCIQNTDNFVKKFIYLSSSSVYGLNENIDFNDEPIPSNAYGKSKFAAEKYVKLLKGNMNVEIVRAANIFGFNCNLRLDSVLNNFIFNGLVHKKILIYGNGDQKRPYASLNNLVKLLTISITEKENPSLRNFAEFNASLNEIKDWLIRLVPDMEYTYVNQNMLYEGQSIKNIGSFSNYSKTLNDEFEVFKKNIRVFN